MATGRLAATALSATTIADIYSPAASTQATVSVVVTNRNASDVTVRLAISATTVTQANGEFIEYEATVKQGKPLVWTGIVLSASDILTAYSSAANVDVVVWGIEETA